MAFSFQRNFGVPTENVGHQLLFSLLRDPEVAKKVALVREIKESGFDLKWLETAGYQDWRKWLKPERRAALDKLSDEKKVEAYCDGIKRSLPLVIFIANYLELKNKKEVVGRWRQKAGVCLNGLCVMDLDHVVKSHDGKAAREYWTQIIAHLDLKEIGVLMAFVSPSGDGLKVVFKARMEWGNLIDNQQAMAKFLGVSAYIDEKCKDGSRGHFLTTEEDLLYIDEEIFEYENKAFGEKYNEQYRDGRTGASVRSGDAAAVDRCHTVGGHSGDGEDKVTPSDSPCRGRTESACRSNEGACRSNEGACRSNEGACRSNEGACRSNEGACRSNEGACPPPTGGDGGGHLSYHGVALTDIIEKLLGGQVPGQGDRHEKMRDLAHLLRYVCDNSPKKVLEALKTQQWVLDLIGEGDPVEATVEGACNLKYGRQKPRELQKALLELGAIDSVTSSVTSSMTSPNPSCRRGTFPSPTGEGQGEVTPSGQGQVTPSGQGEVTPSSQGEVTPSGQGEVSPSSQGEVTPLDQREVMNSLLDQWGEEIGKLFGEFPCLKEVCEGLHREAYPAAMFTAAAFLGTLMTRTWYYFYHRPEEERRLNYCIYIIGDPASGKSFATRLYKLILAPIISADKVGNDAINRYKKELKERGTSSKEQKKEALKQPAVIIRIHGSRTANGVFIEDMCKAIDVVGNKEMHLHMLTFDSELDSSTAASKGGQWIDKSTMELKAFHNEEDNQQYKNVDSVTGPFNVYWNYVYTGTPLSLHRKVTERNFGSGLSTRLAVIPLPPSDFKMMALEKPKESYTEDEVLKEWAYRLDGVSGELPVWPLVETCWEWTRDHMTIAEINKDKSDELLLKRVPYYGISIATPYILMRHWEEWEQQKTFTIDEKDKALCELSLNIQYKCQHYWFGEYARKYFDDMLADPSIQRRRQTTTQRAYQSLPEVFDMAQVPEIIGGSANAARNMISRFCKDGIVERLSHGKYKKLVHIL